MVSRLIVTEAGSAAAPRSPLAGEATASLALRKAAGSAGNNFTPLRLGLALMVVLAHYQWLNGGDFRQFVFPFIYGGFAVQGFFVVSGYLILGSFDRDPNFRRFYVRRVFRIYPLYLAVVLAQTAIMAILVPGGAAAHGAELLRYFAANAAFANFLKRDVGGVLDHLANHGLNASLWTLKIEVAFYAILPALWRLMRRGGPLVLVALFIASATWFAFFVRIGHYDLAKQLPGQLQYFVLGMAGFALRDRIRLGRRAACALALVLGAAITGLIAHHWELPLLYPLLVSAFVIVTALHVPPLRFATDISFGVYLFHAPVIQLSLLLGLYRGDWIGLALTLAVVTSLALQAERYIEAPCIALGRRLTHRASTVHVHPYAP